jgi:hypothetical protein
VTTGNVIVAAIVAAVVAALLYVNLDSGLMTPERAARLFSLPLAGLALIFGVRAWAESTRPDPRWLGLFTGLALGVGGYALVRLAF